MGKSCTFTISTSLLTQLLSGEVLKKVHLGDTVQIMRLLQTSNDFHGMGGEVRKCFVPVTAKTI